MRRYRFVIAALPIAIALASCQLPMSLTISPRASEVPVAGRLEVAAIVHNPNSRAAYRWWADSGRFSPEETTEPATTYIAPSEAGVDRIHVEATVGGRIIARDERTIVVVVPDVETPAAGPDAEPVRSVSITTVPPYDAVGGPNTSAPIGGTVTGVTASEHRVVVYTYTDRWYVQPLVAAPFAPIAPSGAWSTWTHTGTLYAAVLVRIDAASSPDDIVPPAIDALPLTSDTILGVAVVEGLR